MAWLRTFYVDPESVTNGVGTQGDPMNVLPANFSSAGFVNDDEFLLKAGTLYEPAWSGSPGDAFTINRRVRIGKYGTGDLPIVSGDYSGTSGGKLFRVYTSGCVIEEIAIEDMNNAHAIYVQSGIADFTARYNRIRRIRGSDVGNEGGIMVGTGGALTGTVVVTDNVVEEVANDCIEIRCTGAIDLGRNVCSSPSMDTVTGDCMAVVGNCADLHVYQNQWDHTNADTKHCFIQDGGSTGAAVIEDNIANGYFQSGDENHTGIYLTLPGVIRRNRVKTWRSGIYCNGANIRVCDNIVEQGAGSTGTGAIYGGSAGMEVDGNTIVVIDGTDVTDAAIRNNTSDASNKYRNNVIEGFNTGIRKGADAVESHNTFWQVAVPVRNASAVAITAAETDRTDNPQRRGDYLVASLALRAAGTYIAGTDFYGNARQNPPTPGAVQYPAVPVPVWPTLTRANVQGWNWQLVAHTLSQPSPLDGSTQTLEMPGARWACSFSYGSLGEEDAALIEAVLVSLRGRAGTIALWNFARPNPRGVGGGSPKVYGASQTGKLLTVYDAPASTTGWLLKGDYFGVNGELKMLTNDATTNAQGQVTLQFAPMLRSAPPADAALTLVKPTATFRLADDRQSWSVSAPTRTVHHSLSFEEVFG